MAYMGRNKNIFDKDGAVSLADDRRLDFMIELEEKNVERAVKENQDQIIINYCKDTVRFLKELKEYRNREAERK